MPRTSKYTKELLEPLIKISYSKAQVLKKLNLKPTGGNYRNLHKNIRKHGIDTSHFTGQSWSKGKTKDDDKRIAKMARSKAFPDLVIFSLNSSYPSNKLYGRLLKRGWDNACSEKNCMVKGEWNNIPIRLHVDHINGDCSDNRLTNLRLLCPNCHQQTPTWGNKKRE